MLQQLEGFIVCTVCKELDDFHRVIQDQFEQVCASAIARKSRCDAHCLGDYELIRIGRCICIEIKEHLKGVTPELSILGGSRHRASLYGHGFKVPRRAFKLSIEKLVAQRNDDRAKRLFLILRQRNDCIVKCSLHAKSDVFPHSKIILRQRFKRFFNAPFFVIGLAVKYRSQSIRNVRAISTNRRVLDELQRFIGDILCRVAVKISERRLNRDCRSITCLL